LRFSQGGSSINLVELEPADARLYTKAGTPARRLQAALGQLDDWRQWIKSNKGTFVRDMIERAQQATAYDPSAITPASVRFSEPEKIDALWRSFGGYEDCYISYAVIIGRWAKLSENQRKRLIYYNQSYEQQTVFTYDQVARKALVRPDIYEWE
jgi:hypothetical protein